MTNLHDVAIGALDEAAQARDNPPGDDEATEPCGGPEHPQQLIGWDLHNILPKGLNASSSCSFEDSQISSAFLTVGLTNWSTWASSLAGQTATKSVIEDHVWLQNR